jgi:hypothetical protein
MTGYLLFYTITMCTRKHTEILIYDADEEKFKVFSRGLKKPEIWHEGCEDVPAGYCS